MTKSEEVTHSTNSIAGASRHNGYFELKGQRYYKIADYDLMKPFFMTLTSPEDHWIFISSTGGLTAGRKNAEHAMFPYYTDDRITENSDNTGSKTLLQVEKEGQTILWEPFSRCTLKSKDTQRNLYKNIPGNSLIFEEVNLSLNLIFRYEWTSSPDFGLVKHSSLINTGEKGYSIRLLDGVQNILPPNVGTKTQNEMSNLLDAYKRSELIPEAGLGIFALSATLTDLAEPSEALMANTWWQQGLSQVTYVISSQQIDHFRKGGQIQEERDQKGGRGAFLAYAELTLAAKEEKDWLFCGEVNQDHRHIYPLIETLKSSPDSLKGEVEADIRNSAERLDQIIGKNDGLQCTGNELTSSHHYANVMFNVMRGGYFADGYNLDSSDLAAFVKQCNNKVYNNNKDWFSKLPKVISLDKLEAQTNQQQDVDLKRLVREYLPITFSRRHGDPSRPWNRFSINTRGEDGSAKIDYQGNWRDIFQNWEATLMSTPRYVFSVIHKFLNATTADGYNPYRVSRDGIDWEKPEPENPWANIGYWSDHQIIYLEKLLELAEHYYPGEITDHLKAEDLVFANVPYEIGPYEKIKEDPKNTIDFNWDRDEVIESLAVEIGSDGKLLLKGDKSLVHANMTEKLLILLLAKVANFVPDGGIWMNTQRPEWNDANNALVGNGISMVTLYYLIRYVKNLLLLIPDGKKYPFNQETSQWMAGLMEGLKKSKDHLKEGFTPKSRMALMDDLGEVSSQYRSRLYKKGLSGERTDTTTEEIRDFLSLCQEYFLKTMENNIRQDQLFHAYNRLELKDGQAFVHNLYEMLEGQVAGLSSTELSAQQARKTLEALKISAIYREDQDTYMLYPNRELKGYMEKNTIDPQRAKSSKVLQKIVKTEDTSVVMESKKGVFHFNSTFINNKSLLEAIKGFNKKHPAEKISQEEEKELLEIFEETFNHADFTGRSGTFFAFEGLGSIYWHMVSKLLLASQELCIQALEEDHPQEAKALRDNYFAVRKGIGFNKTPEVYGAFPTDPYSHTPYGAGAKQPGMTGQVKEEVITRFREMGLAVREGKIWFDTFLVEQEEYLKEEAQWTYYDLEGNKQVITLQPGTLGFTFCQVPVILKKGTPGITLTYADSTQESQKEMQLNQEISREIFNKTGKIKQIEVSLD